MKKVSVIILAIVIVGGLWIAGQYNSLVTGRAGVATAWSNVEVQYQRRSDIVPQLVATVQGAANFEQTTLTDVVQARAQATQTKVDLGNPASLEAFNASQTQLSGALSRLLVSVEAYPTLTATKGFQDLQSQLEGTENRIAVARGDYNTVAGQWNATVSLFPRVFIARLLGFTPVTLFAAKPGADEAPKIEFDTGK